MGSSRGRDPSLPEDVPRSPRAVVVPVPLPDLTALHHSGSHEGIAGDEPTVQLERPPLPARAPAHADVAGPVEIGAVDGDGVPLPVRIGQVLRGRYRLEEVVALGGIGVILRAADIELSRDVAIKVLTRRASRDPVLRERFRREARMAVKLTSEHVARVLDVGTLDDGDQYIVLEYLEGEDLAQVLARRGPLPIDEAVGYVLQACEALAEAHALGVVHRDVKLSNLFVTRRADGSTSLKVIDFGLARAGTTEGAIEHGLTGGGVVGTPRSMAPEQVQTSQPVDERADVWGLGTVLFELCTGQSPFTGETVQELFAKILFQEAKGVCELRPDAPEELGQVVARCLVKDPAARTPSVAALAQGLAPFSPPETKVCVERSIRVLSGAAGRSAPPLAERPSRSGTPGALAAPSPSATTVQSSERATPPPPPKAPRVSLAVAAVAAAAGIALSVFFLRGRAPAGGVAAGVAATAAGTAAPRVPMGAPCASDADCDGRRCLRGVCSVRCQSDVDCAVPAHCLSEICTLPLRVGFLHFGVVEDEGWTKGHDAGRLFAARALPYVTTDFLTNTYRPEDAERAIDAFVARDFDVLVATSFSHRDAVIKEAKLHPEKRFLMVGAKPPSPDVGSFDGRLEDAFYLAGVAAAQVTKTRRLGFVGPLVHPDAVRYVNAMLLGARRVDPSIVMEVRWVGFWFDDKKPDAQGRHDEERLAQALVDTGCDVVAHSLDNARVPLFIESLAAAGRRLFTVAVNTSAQCDAAPRSCIGAAARNWGPLYVKVLDDIHRGTWKKGSVYLEGIVANPEQSAVTFTMSPKLVSPNVANEVGQALADIGNRFHGRVLTGPFCYAGEPRRCVAEGVAVDDEARRTMCAHVEGVVEKTNPRDPRSPDRPAVVPPECAKNQ